MSDNAHIILGTIIFLIIWHLFIKHLPNNKAEIGAWEEYFKSFF
jgi:hypothetical protein